MSRGADGLLLDETRESIARPYGSGTFYYTATEGGRKVTRSIPLDLNARPAE